MLIHATNNSLVSKQCFLLFNSFSVSGLLLYNISFIVFIRLSFFCVLVLSRYINNSTYFSKYLEFTCLYLYKKCSNRECNEFTLARLNAPRLYFPLSICSKCILLSTLNLRYAFSLSVTKIVVSLTTPFNALSKCFCCNFPIVTGVANDCVDSVPREQLAR
jgi:hypothetical protein